MTSLTRFKGIQPVSIRVVFWTVTLGLILLLAGCGRGKEGQSSLRTTSVPGQVRPVPTTTLTAHAGRINSVEFSRDGNILATAGMDGFVRLWDTNTWKERGEGLNQGGGVYCITFLPNGRFLASGGGGDAIRIWDLNNLRLEKTIDVHGGAILSLAMSSDGERLGCGDVDGIQVWDLPNSQLITKIRIEGIVQALAHSHQGGFLVAGTNRGQLLLVNTETGAIVHEWNTSMSEVLSVALSPDDKSVAVCGTSKMVSVFDLRSFERIVQLSGHMYEVWKVAYAPDGESLGSASGDGSVKIWDAKSGSMKMDIPWHDDVVSSFAFSPSDKILVSATEDGTVSIWAL